MMRVLIDNNVKYTIKCKEIHFVSCINSHTANLWYILLLVFKSSLLKNQKLRCNEGKCVQLVLSKFSPFFTQVLNCWLISSLPS
jgi:hypothetical protein